MASELDSLYGPGSSETLRELMLEPDRMVERSVPTGGVRVDFVWGEHTTMSIECRLDEIAYLSMASKQKGFYGTLCRTDVPKWAAERGVKRFVATAGGPEAQKALLAQGEWEQVGDTRQLIWKL